MIKWLDGMDFEMSEHMRDGKGKSRFRNPNASKGFAMAKLRVLFTKYWKAERGKQRFGFKK